MSAPPSYADVLAEVDKQMQGIAEEENDFGTGREESFQTMGVALKLASLAHPNAVPRLCAAALIALYDERAQSSSLRVALEATEDDRDEARAERDALLKELRKLKGES